MDATPARSEVQQPEAKFAFNVVRIAVEETLLSPMMLGLVSGEPGMTWRRVLRCSTQ